MNSQICISKKIGYLILAIIVIVIGAYVFGFIANLETITIFPQAKESSTFLSARKKIQNTISNSVPCGGENEPVCLTSNRFFCDNPNLGPYTKPVNKTLNQDCRANNDAYILSLVTNMYPENNHLTDIERLNLFQNVFAPNSSPQYQQYEYSFIKPIKYPDGKVEYLNVVGIDPGQICRSRPYLMSDIPEVCPGSIDLSCGRPGEECCIIQVYGDEPFDYPRNTGEGNKYKYECENKSLYCDRTNADYLTMYAVYIRPINKTYAEGWLEGSKCVSTLKKQ